MCNEKKQRNGKIRPDLRGGGEKCPAAEGKTQSHDSQAIGKDQEKETHGLSWP